jgi:hypothetical protein
MKRTAEMKAAMRIQLSDRQGCVVLTLAGRLDLAAAPQVQRAILKQLAEQPPAIICDLGQVEAIDPLSAIPLSAGRARPWSCAAPGRRWPTPSCGGGRPLAWRCLPAWTRR